MKPLAELGYCSKGCRNLYSGRVHKTSPVNGEKMKEIESDFRTLEIPPTKERDIIKKAWRDMLSVWHPDRFSANERLIRRANEKTREINDAYKRIIAYLDARPDAGFSKTGKGKEDRAGAFYARSGAKKQPARSADTGFWTWKRIAIAAILAFDLLIPDFLPFLDEIALFVLMFLVDSYKKKT